MFLNIVKIKIVWVIVLQFIELNFLFECVFNKNNILLYSILIELNLLI